LVQEFNYDKADDRNSSGGQKLEFRLIYQGTLPAASQSNTRTAEKHALRKHFHLQLRELWKQHPDLRTQSKQKYFVSESGIVLAQSDTPGAETWLEHIAADHIRCDGNRFVPLISVAGGFTCTLNILFLRRDNPGNLIDHKGDIDNRIKVLFDGLRLPRDVKELGGYTIDSDEDPFFCLLEDDSLITSVTVTTDRLILPLESDRGLADVMLLIHVIMQNPSAVFAGGRLV